MASGKTAPTPQTALFRPLAGSVSPSAQTGTLTAHCDGGARGNPGPAGYGAEITDAAGNLVAELSEFLGIRTNNYAEYSGLLASLQYALDHGHRSLRVVSDSELMVKQIQGKYKVNSPDLKPLWQEAKARIARLSSFEITHALRHKNKAADRLANEAMDRGMRRNSPGEGQPVLRSHGDPRSGGVESLPLRAIPYPGRSEAPTAPTRMDPAPQRPAAAVPAAKPTIPSPTVEEPAMLRGFTRDGVVHILGSHNLPDGLFVKIIPE